MTELSQLDIFNGFVVIVMMFLFLYIGLALISKYRQYHDKKLLYLGLSLITQILSWSGSTVNFLSILITGNVISIELIILLSQGFLLPILLWMMVWTELMYKEKQKIILTIFLIFWLALEISFFYLYFTDISLIADFREPVTVIPAPYLRIRFFILFIISLGTVFLFYRESHKSDNPEIRLRGTLILSAIILQLVGAVIAVITLITFFALLFIIPALIFFYAALIMPDWTRRIFLKEKEE